jgi:hypothetical protein
LNVPSSFSKDFQAQFIFQQTGYLHGMGKIQAISVLMPLICSVLSTEATNTNKAYLTFYMMICSDINDLLSTKFRDDDEIDMLYKRIVETVIIHEGLYPISESMITWHQLIDLPFHIKKFGPLRCWWEFFGERSLSNLKNELPEGGSSNDKSIMKTSSVLEENNLQKNFNFNLNDHDKKGIINESNFNFTVGDHQLQYTDEKFLMSNLIGSEKLDKSDMKFNQFEIELLLDLFITEIKKHTKNIYEAYYNSPVYRMFTAYNYHKKLKNISSFYSFLNDCIDVNSHLYINFCISKKDSIYFILCKENNNYKNIEEAYFMLEDLETVKIILFNFSPLRFADALIFGVSMTSRGVSFAELENSMDNMPTNKLNILKNNWFSSKKCLSSWFKYRYDENSDINDQKFGFNNYTKYCFGQFNYFFRIYLPHDVILNGLPFASAVCRFSNTDDYMSTIDISTNEESYVLRQPFVALTNVFSTKLLVGARDIFKVPIKLKKNYNLINSETMKRTISDKNPRDANDLYLLDLQPYRKTVKFDSRNFNYHKFEYKNQYY